MPLYEHVFLARQDVSNTQVETLTKEYTDVIEQGGGKVTKNEYWGVKSLAYKIKKNRKAHFSLLNIDAPHAAVAEMERRMGLSTEIIRFLTIRVDEHETEPSVMMRKSDRDDRGDRDRGGFGGRGGARRRRIPRRPRPRRWRPRRAAAAIATGVPRRSRGLDLPRPSSARRRPPPARRRPSTPSPARGQGRAAPAPASRPPSPAQIGGIDHG